MNNNLTTIYIVRHGESEGNVSFAQKKHVDDMKRFGKLQSPLTELGKAQAKEIAQRLNNIQFDAIFSSHLSRAKQTADIIAAEKQLAVHVREALQERVRGISMDNLNRKYEKRSDTSTVIPKI